MFYSYKSMLFTIFLEMIDSGLISSLFMNKYEDILLWGKILLSKITLHQFLFNLEDLSIFQNNYLKNLYMLLDNQWFLIYE